MEYVQERITTLHGIESAPPPVDPETLAATAVVVPMTDREHATPAAHGVFSELERLDPAAVYVPVRAPPMRIDAVREWLEAFDLDLTVLWCNAPAVDRLMAATDLGDGFGKGRDVWLALGPAAAESRYVVVHDADATSYEADHVTRLLAPLEMDYGFSKGYYARVEDGRLYGRLFRLCYEPLISALATAHDAPICSYLGAFRYALAGEFAATADLIEQLRPPRAWGLEVATLGDAFDHVGFDGTAQVDLGRHEHDHRAVAGESGLEGMSRQVVATLLGVVSERGVDPDYERLPGRYRDAGERLIDQYAADARFNGLVYDRDQEREQLERYAASIVPPAGDRRLPRWADASLDPGAVVRAAQPWQTESIGPRTGD